MIDTAQACLNEEAVGNAWKKNTFCPKFLLYTKKVRYLTAPLISLRYSAGVRWMIF